MNDQTRADAEVKHRGVAAVALGLAAVLYTLLVAGCAGYLLWKAYSLPAGTALDEFNKLAIAALIAVIGTGLTGFASVYGATRQSATAYQIAQYNGAISTNLAEMKEKSDRALAEMKATVDESLANLKIASDESLARLKAALDAGQIAHRELYGAATIYFYAIRSIARGKWDDDSLKIAETSMISVMQHLIHVDGDVRNPWFDFWQRAHDINQSLRAEPDVKKRPKLAADLIGEKVQLDSGRLDFRELHNRLEQAARRAIA
jgi:hypothetical protein